MGSTPPRCRRQAGLTTPGPGACPSEAQIARLLAYTLDDDPKVRRFALKERHRPRWLQEVSHVRFIGRGTDQRAVTESPLAHHGSRSSSTAELPVTTATELASWVREELSLPPQAKVDVAEQPGTDPRCSDVVTHIGIETPGEEAYDFHVECPLAEMTRMDLVAAIAFGGAH